MSMFCYQCEQTAKGQGCTIKGVCGKDETTASLLDLLLYGTKGLAMYAIRARQYGYKDDEIDLFTIQNLFTTITNVNFDPERIKERILKLANLRDKIKQSYEEACLNCGDKPEELGSPADFIPAIDIAGMIKQAKEISIPIRKDALGEDITALQELLTYGLKGAAAYADHAQILGHKDDKLYAFFYEALDYLTKPDQEITKLLELSMQCGQINMRTMELLDKANTSHYGHPEPTQVRVTPIKGKAILVSGHDLKDLEEILKQTEGKGINVYTHGEMLPAHGYPKLKAYKHLVGNYGGAWQDQQKEFSEFPGAILMTTNCIQEPKPIYKDKIFTSGLVAWPGVTHINNHDFSKVIETALNAEGFKNNEVEKYITVGFGHNAVLGVADKVIDSVKNGHIKHFYLIGGCDGAKTGRNYFTEFATSVPKDSIILTLACGKYRFNKLEFGTIDGIPRLLDIGQCNDAYSAIQIAVALAKAFNTDVNGLPLSIILSWYEQKAVAILLTLLSLGVKNIRLGPSLPAFVTPNILNILIDKFNIKPISTVEEDLKNTNKEKATV